jgi:DNA repair exonuclease SbcCD ATPase subunit
MILQAIEIENFKSFRDEQTLKFDDLGTGLFFVSGENLLEPELGANGAGKSALFEALCWGLYGKTSTNLKAGNIVNWNEKGCRVILYFDTFSVVRTQNPNAIYINEGSGEDSVVTQEELEVRLGNLGFESFLYSTFISQFSSKFFDLSPADKMVVFSDIMAETLKPWLVRSDQAKVKAEEKKKQMDILIRDHAELNGQLIALEETSYESQIKRFDKEKKEQIKVLNDERQAFSDDLKKTHDNHRKLLEDQKILARAIAKMKDVDRSEAKELSEKAEQIKDKVNGLVSEVKSLERSLKDMERSGTYSICPTCKQKVNAKVLKDEIKKTKKDIQYLTGVIETKDGEYQGVLDQLVKVQEKMEKDREAISSLNGDLRVLQMAITGSSATMNRLESDIKKCGFRIKEAGDRENDYIQLEAARKKRIREVRLGIDGHQGGIDRTRKDYDAYLYWVKGFREIRLLLMYDALKEFEVSINNNLSKFGMGDWNVKLDIDKENKSGTLRKGFSVLVESPDHSGFVPFEVWSGGEGQRLRLAGTIGLMDLIQATRGLGFGVEVFDEPTAWMSSKGIDDLLQNLYYRAKDAGKKIFIIDHKDLQNFGGFHKIIKVVKGKNGSTIEID